MAHRYRSVSYDSDRSVSRVAGDDCDGDGHSRAYAEAINYIDRLLRHPNEKITSDPYETWISRIEFLYAELGPREKNLLKDYLQSKCPGVSNITPGTVGAYLCGCFKSDSFYSNINRECSVFCAGTPFEDTKCDKTVVLWTVDEGGNPISKVLSRGNNSCNVYIDPNFPQVSDSVKQNLLLGSGCMNAEFLTSTNRQDFQAPVIQVVQQPIAEPRRTVQGSQVQKALQMQEQQQQQSYWWVWFIAIFLLLIIIGVIIYLYVRGSSPSS